MFGFGKRKRIKHIRTFTVSENPLKQMFDAGVMLDNWYLERKKKELELKVLESQIKDSKPKADYIEGLEKSTA